jgi:ubiquitin carboxyl-terminal hydrolase 7
VSRLATFEEVIQTLIKKQTSIPPELYERIRLFDVRNHKDYKELQPTQALSTTSLDTSYGTNFFAEPIPQEEQDMSDQDKFIMIVHFSKDISRLHSFPLKFVVKPVFLSLYIKLTKI